MVCFEEQEVGRFDKWVAELVVNGGFEVQDYIATNKGVWWVGFGYKCIVDFVPGYYDIPTVLVVFVGQLC